MFKDERHNSLYVVRITSDTLTSVDDRMIPAEVTSALEAGLRHIVFAITVGSLANQVQISTLLIKCKEIAGKFNASLIVVEKNNGLRGVYGLQCHALQVPLYTVGFEEGSVVCLHNKHIEYTEY
jgi:hypothetical protein